MDRKSEGKEVGIFGKAVIIPRSQDEVLFHDPELLRFCEFAIFELISFRDIRFCANRNTL